TGPTTVYHDPVSGENIVNQEGKATEGQSSSSTTPTYAGFDKLLEVGFTLNQLDSAYSAFEQYQPFASNKVQISLAVNDVSTVRPNDADPLYRWSVVSHIVVNRTDSYKVQIYYWGENSAELVLLNADGSQQLFDSGPLNTSDTPDID
ncbi:MAG TPA: hypothetical protein VLF69_02610, partial [Candidatus Saccharimonadales bacterium]|nr:hypothetical protein [Candidatus Saccharimonadales bacterium]